MPWVGYLAAAVVGVLVGWLIAAMWIRRADGDRRDSTSPQAALAAEVVAHSDSGYLVTDHQANVLMVNQRARDLGVVRAGMPDRRVAEAIGRCAVSGEPIDIELGAPDPSTTPTTATTATAGPTAMTVNASAGGESVIHAVASPLGAELILVTAVDESAARRVETIRRDFVANVSHELKTPVAAMGLLAEAVLDSADDPDTVRHFGSKLVAESSRLGTLMNELIALSRLQGGLVLHDMAVVEIDGVVADALARVATSAEAASISVVSDAPCGRLVRGDRTLLVTALANLLENAISYSPGGTTVSVARSVRSVDPSGRQLIDVSVTDRGIGIAPEHQKRVFERFFRVDPARSRATGGTGLGLAIVKHVAANHGGQALLWSRVGTGSTFTLRLPLVSDPAERTAGHPADQAVDAAPAHDERRATQGAT